MVELARFAEQHPEQEAHRAALAQVRVVLGARDVQLALGDLPVADQPRVLALVLAHALQRRVRVERRHHRRRAVAAPVGVEHHARARRDQLHAVILALRPRMTYRIRVVPHPREVRHVAAHAPHLLVQGAIRVRVRAHQQPPRRAAQLGGRPLAAHQLRVAADAPRSDHDGLARPRLVLIHRRSASGLARAPALDAPRTAAQTAVTLIPHAAAHHAVPLLDDQPTDARPEADLQRRPAGVALDRRPDGLHERLAGTPREVKARHRVAVPEVPALRPVDHREEAHPERAQPTAHVVASTGHVLLRPASRPLIPRLELGDPQPVLERQLLAVGDPRAALLRGVHHEHPAERLPGQPTQLLRGAAIQQQHRVPAAQQLQRAHQARETGPDDDHVGLGGLAAAVRAAHASAIPGATCTSISSGPPDASARRSSTPSSSVPLTRRAFTP